MMSYSRVVGVGLGKGEREGLLKGGIWGWGGKTYTVLTRQIEMS